MASASLAWQLASTTVGVTFDVETEEVREKVGACLLDFLSACLDGVSLPWSQQAIQVVVKPDETGPCAVLGTGSRASPSAAIFANSVLGASTSRMDTFPESATHPGVAVIPAALAAAEAGAKDGKDLLAAIVAGYEVTGVLAAALFSGASDFRIRPTGVVGPVGAAAAIARAWVLPVDQVVNALALAANTGAGLMEWASAGTMELAFHAAFAARNGWTACALAATGASAAPTALDGKRGLIATFGTRASSPDGRLPPSGRQILSVLHKPVPACIYVQSPCQTALQLVRTQPINAARIRRVRIGVHPTAIAYPGCDNATPIADPQSARMSIQHSVAAVLVREAIEIDSWQRPAHDPRVGDLASRCSLYALAGVSEQACSLEIETESGKLVRSSASSIQSPGNDEVAERFVASARHRLSAQDTQKVLAWAADLSTLKRASDLTSILMIARAGLT